MTDNNDERRRFKRFAFDAYTRLQQGEKKWEVRLLDLSLKGLLIDRPGQWDGDPKEPFEATIRLSNEVEVSMSVRQSHQEGDHLGFECQFIDLESVTELRRVVELNVGDPKELDRELGALIAG